jgi:hypothetical protein
MGPHEVVFTWLDPVTEEEVTFAVERLAKWAALHCETVETPVELVYALAIIRDRGLEQHRMDKLTLDSLLDPVLYLAMPGGTHLLADGNHRYVYAAFNGVKWLRARMVDEEHWRKFIVTGLPKAGKERILGGYSGL